MPPYADDEGHAELRTVGVVEAVEGGEFLLAQTVETRRRPVRAVESAGQLAFARSLSGKIGMTVDQRALALVRGLRTASVIAR